MLDATRTLHRDHDPQRALELVARYLETYPHGALEEESLALVIEAKARLGDAGATSAARDYLQRFPHGRFRTLALQALGKAGP